MRKLFVIALIVILTAGTLTAQDPLAEATEAWRAGDLPRAARLFNAAADAEQDPLRRADIRVKLAWTYFLMRNLGKAEEALTAALGDQPQLELVPDYYTEDFMNLFARTKQKVAPATPAAAAGKAPASPPPSLQALRQKLAQAIDFAAVDSVLTELNQIEQTAPASHLPEILELKAEVLERLGKTEESLEHRGRLAAIRAVAQAPAGTNPWPLDTLLEARRLLANGLAAESAALMRGVLKELPSCGPALEILGEALLAAGRYDEAYGALQTALFANETPELLMALGEVELHRGREANARNLFRRAADADPGNDRAWAALGLIAAARGDRPAATAALDSALQANGTLFEARVVRGEIALADGDLGAATQHLRRALQVRPDDPWASGWLGVALLAAGNLDAAEPALRRGHEAQPELFALSLAELLRRRGDPGRALEIAVADGERQPAAAAAVRGRCLLDLGRPAEAAAALRQGLEAKADDGQLTYLLGVALHEQRKWQEAVSTLEQAAQLSGAPEFARDSLDLARATLAAQRLADGADPVPAAPPRR